MAEDKRRSAEIRRMASQKVAAELLKISSFAPGMDMDMALLQFRELVNLIDDDVVAAGDRAEGLPADPEHPTPGPTPQNGSDAARALGETLGKQARQTLTALFEKVEPEVLRLKLYEMELPMKTEVAVNEMTKEQAKTLLPWLREKTDGS